MHLRDAALLRDAMTHGRPRPRCCCHMLSRRDRGLPDDRGGASGVDGLGDHLGGTLAGVRLADPQPGAVITGTPVSVLIALISGESPLRRICFPTSSAMPIAGTLFGVAVRPDAAANRYRRTAADHAPGTRSTRWHSAVSALVAPTRVGGKIRK